MPKVALITGAAQRIGRSIALHLAEQGWDIAAHFHTSQFEADLLVQEILKMGRRAISLQADLAVESQAELLFEVALREFESIHCLVNCASVFIPDTPLTADHVTWEKNIHTNLRAPLILSQAFARQKESAESRVIINITDAMAYGANISHTTYALSKASLQQLTRMFAKALAPKVRVNDIALGFVIPPVHTPYTHFEELCLKTPLAIPTSMEEIHHAVSFILKAQSMTGATLTLDSGAQL